MSVAQASHLDGSRLPAECIRHAASGCVARDSGGFVPGSRAACIEWLAARTFHFVSPDLLFSIWLFVRALETALGGLGRKKVEKK